MIHMEMAEVAELFDFAFVSVTQKIASLDLKREPDRDMNDEEKYIGSVSTKGRFNSLIVCEISPEVYDYIIDVMNGGEMMSEDERILYIKEYINIVCGYALSQINNKMGPPPSRLTPPAFGTSDEMMGGEESKSESLNLYYETDMGVMRVSVFCGDIIN